MRNKSFLIVRDKPLRRGKVGEATRKRFDDIVSAGGEVYILVDNSALPEDGFVYSWRDLNTVAYKSYDEWLAAKQTEHKEVEYG
jgi:hypothetical protein